MGKPFLNAAKYSLTNEYLTLSRTAKEQNLCLFPFEYMHDKPFLEIAGTYLVVCPDERYMKRLKNNKEMLPELLRDQKLLGKNSFNPCYQIINFTKHDWESNSFYMYMTAMKAIRNASNSINAFRTIGFSEYPESRFLSDAEELYKLNQKRNNVEFPAHVRKRYDSTYRNFAEYVYCEHFFNKDKLFRAQVYNQTVEESYFVNNNVTALTDYMTNDHYIDYFLEHVREYPEFYYFMDRENPVVIQGVAKGWKGKSIDPDLKDREFIKITFPHGLQDCYYKIMTDFNMQYYSAVKDVSELGELSKIVKMRINGDDLNSFDFLCREDNVRYYLNHGDLEYLSCHNFRDPMIAFNVDDQDRIDKIFTRIAEKAPLERPMELEDVKKAAEKIKQDPVRVKIFSRSDYGLGH